MAVQDIRSDLISQFMGITAVLTADDIEYSPGVIDGADYELGVMFSARVVAATATGTLTFEIQASETDPTFASDTVTYTPASTEFIGDGVIAPTAASTHPTVTGTDPDFTVTQNLLATAGIFSNPRFLRVGVRSVGTDGNAQVELYAIQKAENMPTAEPDA